MRIDTNFYGMYVAPGSLPGSSQLRGISLMNNSVQRPTRVTAVFQGSRLSFDLARGATFAQLAERLARLGEAHGGLPLSVDVRVPVDRSR